MSIKNPKTPLGVKIAGLAAKGLFSLIGKLFATIVMVGIITGCIVASVLTVYILQLVEADEEIELQQYALGYTSIVYYYDENGDAQEMQRMYNPNSNRIWVDFDQITDYTKNALVSIEDKRFYEHEGVDWKRTVGAFVGMFMPVEGTISGGGSTITQQLIKNITNDKEVRIDRKVREIFRAINLSQRYSRDQILEAYLNVVPFGNGTNGIEAAANSYFGKHSNELTLAESAAIVGITQFPTKYNPFLYPENNKERQIHVLDEMLEQERITQEEYDKAVKEKLNFKTIENEQKQDEVWSYFTDYVVKTVIEDLKVKYELPTTAAATKQFYEGGYRVYTTVDMEIQQWLEKVYLNTDLFPPVWNAEYPQSCSVITDVNGKILGMAGGIGEKTESRILNRVTDSKRQPGSSFKPIATYSLAIENNQFTFSSIVEDSQMNLARPGQPAKMWPTNYYRGFEGPITIDRAIYNSVNTVAAKVMQYITPRLAFDFLKNDLGFTSLVEREVTDGGVQTDVDLAPMALGALTYGVTPLEMAGAYQIFANGGTFTPPYAYTKVEDSNGKVVLEPDITPRQVIGEDTAGVMNHMLQDTNKLGTARMIGPALGPNAIPTAGKTGTSEYDLDQWYMGVTPYYVCQTWLGFDIPVEMKVNPATGTRQAVRNTIGYSSYPPPNLWKTIMTPLAEKQEYKPFPESDQVVSMQYCTNSGNLAAPGCPVATGWYKKSNLPKTCTGHRAAEEDEDGDDSGDGDSGDEDSGDSSEAKPARDARTNTVDE